MFPPWEAPSPGPPRLSGTPVAGIITTHILKTASWTDFNGEKIGERRGFLFFFRNFTKFGMKSFLLGVGIPWITEMRFVITKWEHCPEAEFRSSCSVFLRSRRLPSGRPVPVRIRMLEIVQVVTHSEIQVRHSIRGTWDSASRIVAKLATYKLATLLLHPNAGNAMLNLVSLYTMTMQVQRHASGVTLGHPLRRTPLCRGTQG
jgi:hypothetical protein